MMITHLKYPLMIVAILTSCEGFSTRLEPAGSPSPLVLQLSRTRTNSLDAYESSVGCGRREMFQNIAGATTAVMITFPTPARAYPQEKEDKEKIAKGYARLSYLLKNWDAETTICQYSGKTTGCERSPMNVMEYMGFRSTEDPLFNADRRLKRLAALVDDNDSMEYIEAQEKWLQAAEEANGMAYVSSWGEANPGGGKDRVQLFIERSKKNVMDARDALGTAMDLLKMER